MLDSRERLRRCFWHEELDRPGVYVRTNWPEDDPTYDPVKAYVLEHTDLKTPYRLQGLEVWPAWDVRREHYSEDFARDHYTLHTPAGDLTATALIGLRLLPSMQETHFIKTPEDVRLWLSLPLPPFKPGADAARPFFSAVESIGDRGIVDADMGTNPAGIVAGLLGSETFAEFSVTHRDLLHEMCRRQQEIILRRLKHALSLGIGPYFSTLGQEFIVPPLHGRSDFEDFCLFYDKPIFDLVHEAGGKVHVHCHGRVKTVFDLFLDMGADVVHPVEPPPMGDLTAREAKAIARGRLCIEGNLQIAHMYEHTPQQVYEETRQLITDVFDDRRGLIVSPSASLYQKGKGGECFEQVRAMVEAVMAAAA